MSAYYKDTISKLEKLSKFGIHLGLERIEALLEKLGNPQQKFKSIHVAGTNGKGTVCAVISSILKEAGYKVGMYTSPHLMDYRERFKINGIDISEKKFAGFFDRIKSFSKGEETEFEILTALAFEYFAHEKVDFAVVEVGLGGRLDATNTLYPLVTVITNVDYDHTDRLGKTLSKIAFEKAGIIKENVPLVIAERKQEPLGIIKQIAQNKNVLIFGHKKTGNLSFNGFKLPSNQLLGEHFTVNFLLALRVIDILRSKEFNIGKQAVKNGLKKVSWPGRGQIISNNPLILLDGAHNPAGIRALCKSIKKYFPSKKTIFILGMLKRKNLVEILKELKSTASLIIAVQLNTSEKAFSPQEICLQANKLNIPCEAQPNVLTALDYAKIRKEKNKLICVTGSLYLVGEIIKNFVMK
jgi:dihydrofolate synthase/folylpolyglutamate synthase